MAYDSGYQGNFAPRVAFTIANGQQISSTIPLGGFVPCGFYLPAAFTGTTITFLASNDNVTFFPVYSTTSGTALSYTVAQGHYVAVDPKDFYGIAYLQVKSGTAEGAARSLAAALKGF